MGTVTHLPIVRCLYAHAIDEDPETLNREALTLSRALRRSVRSRGADSLFAVTPGFADWNEHSRNEGAWKCWPECAPGRYDLVIVPDGEIGIVGSGVARIVMAALRGGIPVYAIRERPEDRLARVAVVGVDPDDKSGDPRRMHLANRVWRE